MKQTSFFKDQKLFHGGALSLKKRKTKRILCSKRAIHLILKSNQPILRANKKKIEAATQRYAKRFGIKLYHESIQRDHYHQLIRVSSRQAYGKFIRALTSYLARHLGRGLWKLLPFTRVVNWGRSYKIVKEYIEMNEREILGLQPYRKRKDLYARFLAGG